jgi:hypothetical protein
MPSGIVLLWAFGGVSGVGRKHDAFSRALVQNWYKSKSKSFQQDKLLNLIKLSMVEAARVEPFMPLKTRKLCVFERLK